MAHVSPPLIMLVLIPLFLVILLSATAFWLWALVDCIHRESPEQEGKLGWIVLICIFHWIGALCYVLFRRSRTVKS